MGLASGDRLASYTIVGLLGRGGMGEVYLAEDEVLKRRVAIKLVHAEELSSDTARRRLMNEARAAARLEHPHICPVFEVGEHGQAPFIVMPFIEGETLAARVRRTRLSPDEAIAIAIQLASALQEAHDRGVVHRDIKPQNIMLTAQGHVKLMDFGLAKFTQSAGTLVSGAETATLLTAPHTVAGTASYMSPEQARGDRLDARSDLFSLGSTLFEVLSGRPPFVEPTVTETIAAVLLKAPPPIHTLVDGIPEALERVIDKCLEKDLAKRYQTSAEILADLRSMRAANPSAKAAPASRVGVSRVRIGIVAATLVSFAALGYYAQLPVPSHTRGSLAVLPFAVATGVADGEYLGDGLAEGLITALARVPGLRVKSRHLTFPHRGREADAQAVARALEVETILTGRITPRDDRLVVTVELIDGANGNLLWSEQVDRPGSDIIGVQEAIARGVSARLRPGLSPQEQGRVSRADTDDPEAYRFYLRGRYHWSKLTPDGWSKGIESFQQAIDRDPAYARAYAGLADCYNLRGIFGLLPARDAFPRAKQAAARALEIDPAMAEAHTSLGLVSFYYDWNWEVADRETRQATVSDPEYAYGHNIRGVFLAAMGRSDEALVEGRRAEELEPLSTLHATNVGLMLYFAKRFDEAVVQFRRALELDANYFTAHFWMGNVLAHLGRHREALVALDQAHRLSGGQPIVLAAEGYVQGRSKNHVLARAYVDKLETAASRQYVPAYFLALVHLGLDDRNEAFRWLERAFEERSGWMARLKVEPWMDELRGDPRFAALMQRVSRTW